MLISEETASPDFCSPDGAQDSVGFVAAIQAVSGPLPDWHPEVLRLLVSRRRFATAVAAIRHLIKHLKLVRGGQTFLDPTPLLLA